MLVFLVAMTTWLSHRLSSVCQSPLHVTADSVLYLNLKRDPSRVKSLRLAFPVVGWRSRKKAWLSTAHFHRCLQLLELASWNTNVCSCSRPCADGKQTPLVGQLASVCVRVCLFVCVQGCVCDRMHTWSSSSTTTSVSRLFLKSNWVILGLKNREPITELITPRYPWSTGIRDAFNVLTKRRGQFCWSLQTLRFQ